MVTVALTAEGIAALDIVCDLVLSISVLTTLTHLFGVVYVVSVN